MRSAERLEGLAISGSASLGDRTVRVPLLLDSGTDATGTPRLVGDPGAPPGRRRWRIDFGDASIRLESTIPAPEIAGSAAAEEIGPGVWTLHLPAAEEDWSRLAEARPRLLQLSNARALFAQGEAFVAAVGEIRRRLGAAPLLWAPRLALPHRLALLVYLGVDVHDTTEGRWRAAEGATFDASLGESVPGDERGTAPVSVEPLLEEYRSEMDRVARALAEGRLRELVELRLGSEPALAELLRYADRELGGFFEERAPVTGGPTGRYVYRESMRRPEARRYRERFLSRYRAPPAKSVLLLVPCSQTKPYRHSRSHRRFARALEGLTWAHRVHVVSVTSPLGLVPQELEDLPPARHYDIPVTGEWDETERDSVVAALAHLLSTGRYERQLAHLDPEEYEFLEADARIAGRLEWVVSDSHTTSNEAVAALRSALERVGPPSGEPLGPLAVVREELEALARMQFGPEGAGRLFAPPVRLRGRPWFQRLTDPAGIDLASWQERRGLFQLTVAGGRRLRGGGLLEVEVDPALPLTGDLFTPGVRSADPAIRAGDAVLLIRGGELAGVGEAALPGRLMRELPRGLAVAVRHRVAAAAPAPLDEVDDTQMSGQDSGTPGPVV